MVADPGTRYGYCTGGVVALGAVVGERQRPARRRLRAAGAVRPARHHARGVGADAHRRRGHGRAHPHAAARHGEVRPALPAARPVERAARRVGGVGRAVDVVPRAHDLERGVRLPLVAPRDAAAAASPVQTFYAIGNGGQQIIVAPGLDLVAVFTGSNYDARRTRCRSRSSTATCSPPSASLLRQGRPHEQAHVSAGSRGRRGRIRREAVVGARARTTASGSRSSGRAFAATRS